MAIVKPLIFTPIHDDEFSVEYPSDEELLKKMIRNINMLRALVPAGMLQPVHINIDGVPLPTESTAWMLCDGAEITDPESPLNLIGTQNVPNLNDVYITAQKSGYTDGNTDGGNAAVNLTHNHMLGVFFPGIVEEIGSDRDGVNATFAQLGHAHFIPDGLNDSNADYSKTGMAHMKMAYYMKIK